MHIFFLSTLVGLLFFPQSDITRTLMVSLMSLVCFITSSVLLGMIDGDYSIWKNFQNLPKKWKIIVGITLIGSIPFYFFSWIQFLIFSERKEVMKT